MAIQDTKKGIRKYNINQPTQVKAMAVVLKKYIVDNQLSAVIVGKNYVLVEGWQFAGGLLGFFPKVVEVKCLEDGTKWMAKVEIVRQKDNLVVSSGFALCSKTEAKKRSFDEYAILSMAQTRAIGKAFRNYIGWVIKLAGYEATPAEEMKEKPSKPTAPSVDVIIQSIKKVKDEMTLREMKEKVEKTKKYTTPQRDILMKAIDEQIKKCI